MKDSKNMCEKFISYSDTNHCNVIPVKKDLIKLGNSSAFWGGLILGDIFQKHIHKIIKTQQCSNNFFIILHNDVDS